MTNTADRFSNRVQDYAKYRPGYPQEVVQLLTTCCNLRNDSIIADIGSGTGKLSELFLRQGNLVYGIEPNIPMRQTAETLFAGNSHFKSIDGAAESTGLPNNSVDFVTAGQAFHWFDRKRARAEFARILKPDGWVVIVWNERRLDSSPFLRAYEELLLTYGTDYQEVRHENVLGELADFFAPQEVILQRFQNLQEFDYEGLKGRISSTSYTPEPGSDAHLIMLEALRGVFTKHSSAGKVVFEYDTNVYYGRLM
jgi:SAM-dependent methyltransferase